MAKAPPIPGTAIFDGAQAMKGYALNKLCYSFNDAANREAFLTDPKWATQFNTHQLVEQAGTQGVELLMWLATRATLGDRVQALHQNYHIPISNTASGLMLLEPAA